VTDEEVETYYRAHPDEFTNAKKVRAAVIRITVPARASDEKKAQLAKRAEAARAEALGLNPATRSFGPVAVRYSDHQATRYRGGDTGWLAIGKLDRRWPEEVNKAIFALSEAGKVGPVITTADGHYIVKLMETRDSAPQPLAAVKAQIRHQLYNHKRVRVEDEFYRELKTKVPVRVDHVKLETIEPVGGSGGKMSKPPALPRQ
jgi:parvulin-like peptidyl-prolyl isomerase